MLKYHSVKEILNAFDHLIYESFKKRALKSDLKTNQSDMED